MFLNPVIIIDVVKFGLWFAYSSRRGATVLVSGFDLASGRRQSRPRVGYCWLLLVRCYDVHQG